MRVRIGKDIKIKWAVLTDGSALPLNIEEYTLELVGPNGKNLSLDFEVEGNVLATTFFGKDQNYTGDYMLTLWKNKGQAGQSVVDKASAFSLVRYTSQEDPTQEYDNLNTTLADLGDTSLVTIDGASETTLVCNLTGYKAVESVSDLPNESSTLGFLLGDNLYVYVGQGGDVLDGRYKNCGPFRGPKGDTGEQGPKGNVPLIRYNGDTQQVSYDEGASWQDIKKFTNNLRISLYIGVDEALPVDVAEGTVVMQGPTFGADDLEHTNPIYRMWIYSYKAGVMGWHDNGIFSSISAGVVQKTGNSATEVMSQKAVTEKLTEIGNKIDKNHNNNHNDICNISRVINGFVDTSFVDIHWDNGTFYSTSIGQPLVIYDEEAYTRTRKRTRNIFTALSNLTISADGFLLKLLEIDSRTNLIISSFDYSSKVSLRSGRNYALIVKEENDNDISEVSVADILTVKSNGTYTNQIITSLIDGGYIDIPFSNTERGAIESTTGSEQLVEDYHRTGRIDISIYKSIRYGNITTMSATKFGMAFYDKDGIYISGNSASLADSFTTVEAIIDVPENAKYAAFSMWKSETAFYLQGKPKFNVNKNVSDKDESDLALHTKPESEGVLNCIKRARQLSDIKWTPLMRIPRDSMMNNSTVHWLDWFNSETEYTGIPYSGGGEDDANFGDPAPLNSNCDAGKWGYRHMFVGLGVPFEAFVTAARYPNSIMGERVNQSAWSFDSSLYGTVCSALVTYAFDLGGGNVHKTANGFCANWDGRFSKITDSVATMDIELSKLCDVYEHPTHVAMITDIIRDKSGQIEYIEVTEATTVGNGSNGGQVGSQLGGRARRKFWTVAEIKERYNKYKLWRFIDFGNIEYIKSPFVTLGNEAYMEPVIDYPCIPYLGVGARYKKGFIHNSKVLIGATGFNKLIVMKDGTLFGEFTINSDTKHVEVGFSELGYYEAYLSKGSVTSMRCNWSVIEDDGK